MMKGEIIKTYFETFDDGPGGWLSWISNSVGAGRVEISNGVVISRSPWWVDYNHAPPGAGYLHLTMFLSTSQQSAFRDKYIQLGGKNRFIEGRYGTDFRNARVTIRLKGELELHGAQLLLLTQAKINGIWVNYVLTGQPFKITPVWSVQTVKLIPEESQWRRLGSRHDRKDFYGYGAIEDVIRDLNGNIIFVLFPLNIVPEGQFEGNLHLLKAGEDYPVKKEFLPQGNVIYDYVQIEFASK